jgi:hypothetical protein
MENLKKNIEDNNLTVLNRDELLATSGGCKEWLIIFGLAGIACYVGWHDASKGKHE